jgi:hypothetical protein
MHVAKLAVPLVMASRGSTLERLLPMRHPLTGQHKVVLMEYMAALFSDCHIRHSERF